MKVAVASSGLGHVARGIETWARDTAEALAGVEVDVCLFHAPIEGGGGIELKGVEARAVGCFRRGDRAARWWARSLPPGMWRWGLRSTYGIEQLTFWLALWPKLIRGRFDILHVQDPMLALWCQKFRRMGLVRTRIILAHGTEEPAEFLSEFDYLQQLAPWHLAQVNAWRESRAPSTLRSLSSGSLWRAIPNFVDTEVFCPSQSKEVQRTCRRKLGLPEDAFIVGTVAAVKVVHKRIDYLIHEAARYVGGGQGQKGRGATCFVVAGARTDATPELQALAKEACGDRFRILLDVPREDMPDLLRCYDVFVLTSLFEMMPIAVLEALATGLPLIANRHPVLQWMVGDEVRKSEIGGQKAGHRVSHDLCGGMCVDLSEEGGLVRALQSLRSEWVKAHGAAARRRAEMMFSKDVVIGRYVDYYRQIMGAEPSDQVESCRTDLGEG